MGLAEAIAAFDLPAHISSTYGLHLPSGKRGHTLSAPYRSDSRPSLSVYFKGGKWRFKDFGDESYGGDALDWLRQVDGLGQAEAVAAITGKAGVTPRINWEALEPKADKPSGISKRTLALLERGDADLQERGMPGAFENCPLPLELAEAFGLSRAGEDGLIKFWDWDGNLIAAKRRNHAGRIRYQWCDKGYNNPPWLHPGIQGAEDYLLVFEGEKKALTAAAALLLSDSGKNWGVMALPGAQAIVPEAVLERVKAQKLRVIIFPDPDKPGKEAALRTRKAFRDAGIEAYIADSVGDTWDVAQEVGLDNLARALTSKMNLAVQQLSEMEGRSRAREGLHRLRANQAEWKGQVGTALLLMSLWVLEFIANPRYWHLTPYTPSNGFKLPLHLQNITGWLGCSEATAFRRQQDWVKLTSSKLKAKRYHLSSIHLRSFLVAFTFDECGNDALGTLAVDPRIRQWAVSRGTKNLYIRVGAKGCLVYDHISRHGFCSVAALSRGTGLSYNTTRKILGQLLELGMLKRDGRGYRLAPHHAENERVYRETCWRVMRAWRTERRAEYRERCLRWRMARSAYARTQPMLASQRDRAGGRV